MKEIAFIFPQESKGGNFILYPPLGLLYLVSIFKKDNWNVSFINGQLLDPKEYERRIQKTIDNEYFLNPDKPWNTIREWLRFYNFERIHLTLNGLTPQEKLLQCVTIKC